MAQSLISYYCFNDNSASLVKDFSVNEQHSTTASVGISTDGGAIGKIGTFNGSSNNVQIPNNTAFDNITGFSIVLKFRVNAIGSVESITERNASFKLELLGSGALKFSIVDSSASVYTVTSTTILTAGTWYTIVARWNAEIASIYVNNFETEDNAGAGATNMETTSATHFIGRDFAGAFFDGDIEMISFYSKALNNDEINAVMEIPSGIQYAAGDGKIQTGDLIYNGSGQKEVCTWYEVREEREHKDGTQKQFKEGNLQIYKL